MPVRDTTIASYVLIFVTLAVCTFLYGEWYFRIRRDGGALVRRFFVLALLFFCVWSMIEHATILYMRVFVWDEALIERLGAEQLLTFLRNYVLKFGFVLAGGLALEAYSLARWGRHLIYWWLLGCAVLWCWLVLAI